MLRSILYASSHSNPDKGVPSSHRYELYRLIVGGANRFYGYGKHSAARYIFSRIVHDWKFFNFHDRLVVGRTDNLEIRARNLYVETYADKRAFGFVLLYLQGRIRVVLRWITDHHRLRYLFYVVQRTRYLYVQIDSIERAFITLFDLHVRRTSAVRNVHRSRTGEKVQGTRYYNLEIEIDGAVVGTDAGSELWISL